MKVAHENQQLEEIANELVLACVKFDLNHRVVTHTNHFAYEVEIKKNESEIDKYKKESERYKKEREILVVNVEKLRAQSEELKVKAETAKAIAETEKMKLDAEKIRAETASSRKNTITAVAQPKPTTSLSSNEKMKAITLKSDCSIKEKSDEKSKDLFILKKGGKIAVVEIPNKNWSKVVKGKIVPEGFIMKSCY